jgi:hypothetical protein
MRIRSRVVLFWYSIVSPASPVEWRYRAENVFQSQISTSVWTDWFNFIKIAQFHYLIFYDFFCTLVYPQKCIFFQLIWLNQKYISQIKVRFANMAKWMKAFFFGNNKHDNWLNLSKLYMDARVTCIYMLQ